MLKATLKTLKAQLAELDHDIDDTIKQSPVWRVADDLLTSVPGVGDVTAHTRSLICLSSANSTAAVSLLSSVSRRSIVTLGRCAASEPSPVAVLRFAMLCTWQRSPQSESESCHRQALQKPGGTGAIKKVALVAACDASSASSMQSSGRTPHGNAREPWHRANQKPAWHRQATG